MKTRLLLSFLFMITASLIWGQDIHWSQYNHNPIFQNPAESGRFNGTARFHANYRDQWRSVTVPFSTFSFSADMKFSDLEPKLKNFGLGLLLFHDVAGDGKLRTVELQVSPSYNFKLNEDSTHNIRVGVQLGMNHRQLVFNNLYWDSQFDGVQYNPSLPTNETYETQKKTNFSVGVGTVYEWSVSTRKRIVVGLGYFNLNAPNQGFMGEVIRRDRRVNFFINGQFKIAQDWDILPSYQMNFQGKYNEIIFGTDFRYIIKERLEKYLAFYIGGYFRNRDSGFITAGLDFRNWFAGVSYDINFSKLVPASQARGGIEFSLRYILNIVKPKNLHYRICPDYI